MENETTKKGLVGFFDVLGYQNLLERNEPEKIAEDVIPILTNIGERVVDWLKDLHKAVKLDPELKSKFSNDDPLYRIIKGINWIVFSDTIVITLSIEEKDPSNVRFSWMVFFTAAIIIQRELFRAGLPLRGVIEYGKIFIKDTCFAGRTIINAYKLCSQIELSACVLSEYAAEKFLSMEGIEDFYDTYIVEYLVPTKEGEKHLLTVMAHTYYIESPAIHEEVMRSFWGNRKDISLSARQKAQNTEQWLEFLEYRRKTKEAEKKAKNKS